MADNEESERVFVFNTEVGAILQAVFSTQLNSEDSKVASVKFMITIQDEKELRSLGYSQMQIEKMKPQEARDILLAGLRAT